MNQSDFRRELQALYRRIEMLQQRDTASTVLESNLAVETLETLQFSLEELRVAEEEMRQQYEELAATRHAVEAERYRYQELFDFAPHAYLVTDVAGTIREPITLPLPCSACPRLVSRVNHWRSLSTPQSDRPFAAGWQS